MTVIYISNEADNNDLMYADAAANDGNYSFFSFLFFFFFVVSKINDNYYQTQDLLACLWGGGSSAGIASDSVKSQAHY